MKMFWDKHKKKVFVLAFVYVLLFFIIWLWFLLDGFVPTGNDLKKSDWLAFTGSYMAFIGTLTLGAVSVWQTQKANNISHRLMTLESKSKRGYFLPPMTTEYEGHKRDYVYELSRFLELYNCGDDWVNVSEAICTINEQRRFRYKTDFFATTTGKFSKLNIDLKLTETELSLAELKIFVTLHMNNSREYRYAQKFDLIFQKICEGKYVLNSIIVKIIDTPAYTKEATQNA